MNLEVCTISPDNMENLRTILANLLPLLKHILSLSLNVCSLPNVKQTFGEHLDKLNVLLIHGNGSEMDAAAAQAAVNFLPNWLCSPGQEKFIGPRFCKAPYSAVFFNKITLAIREVISILYQFIQTKVFSISLLPKRHAHSL